MDTQVNQTVQPTATIDVNDMSQKALIERYLRGKNRTLTEAQARQLFGVKNLRARMTEMRKAGLRVRTVKDELGVTAYAVSARSADGHRKFIFE